MAPYGAEVVEYRFPKVTVTIIIINVILYVISTFKNGFISIDSDWLYNYGYIPYLVLKDPIDNAYRIFTSMFLHAGILHIFFNMYFLYIFGKAIENSLGSFRFLILYILSGIAASIFHTTFTVLQGTTALAIPAIGASGAISGVLGAYLMLYPGTSLTACWFFFFIPMCFTMRSVYYLIFWFALQVIYGYARLGASIAFFAHAGGFIAGIALLPIVASKARIAALRYKSMIGRIFDFIVHGYGSMVGGLPRTAKALLSILLIALIAGSAYVIAESSTLTASNMYSVSLHAKIVNLGLEYDDKLIIMVINNKINTREIIRDETRILINRLYYAGLLINKELAGKELKLIDKRLTITICDVKVPLTISKFIGRYDANGVLTYCEGDISSYVVKVTYAREGKCYGFLGSPIHYVFKLVMTMESNVWRGIPYVGLIAILLSGMTLYVVLYKDRELVIVS